MGRLCKGSDPSQKTHDFAILRRTLSAHSRYQPQPMQTVCAEHSKSHRSCSDYTPIAVRSVGDSVCHKNASFALIWLHIQQFTKKHDAISRKLP